MNTITFTDAEREHAARVAKFIPPIHFDQVTVWSSEGSSSGRLDAFDVTTVVASVVRALRDNDVLRPDVADDNGYDDGEAMPADECNTEMAGIDNGISTPRIAVREIETTDTVVVEIRIETA